MNLFETVKASVSVPAAARMYGLQPNYHGMVRCPFHDDRHPSMKLNEDYFYCFGCGATGDVIDLTARLFDLRPYEAAKKLAADFGIDPDTPPSAAALAKPKHPMIRAFRDDERYCQRVLCDILTASPASNMAAPTLSARENAIIRLYTVWNWTNISWTSCPPSRMKDRTII